MGGTLRSNLAGEFSYTLALVFCALLLRCARGDAARFEATVAARGLLAAVVLSHLVVGIFAAVGALVIWLFYRPARTALIGLAIGVVGALLTAFWTVPLLATFGYTANMRYEKLTEYVTYLFPTYFWWVFLLAVIALVAAGIRRDRGARSYPLDVSGVRWCFGSGPKRTRGTCASSRSGTSGCSCSPGSGVAELPSALRWSSNG